MKPILYAKNETAFTSNGKGRLECISCKVTEERNGVYECEFEYPITGKLYDELLDGGIIACWHDDKHDVQPFDIYKHSAPINGIVTFNAHHISYRQSRLIATPFSASSCAEAVSKIAANTSPTNPFTYWTDKSVSSAFSVAHPMSVKALLFGQEGSLLDVYGKGEYEFDKFAVKLYVNRGTDSGVTIRYGKNLTDIRKDYDESACYTSIAPYWTGLDADGTETTVYLPEVYVTASGATASPVPMDFSSDFQEKPTVQQLRDRATAYLNANTPWIADENITVNFVQLWQTREYENVAALQRLSLCDTVSVFYPELGVVQTEQKVIKVVYNVLTERYDSMELGQAKTSLAENIEKQIDKKLEQKASVGFLRDAIEHATEQITGGLGGYIVFTLNANGWPVEMLIMDTPDVSTAVNVWRFNSGGLGHSHSGYNGPFDDVALTQDGKINASMITAGTLNANVIRAGIIMDALSQSWWNLATGELHLYGYNTAAQTQTLIEQNGDSVLIQAKSYSSALTNNETVIPVSSTYTPLPTTWQDVEFSDGGNNWIRMEGTSPSGSGNYTMFTLFRGFLDGGVYDIKVETDGIDFTNAHFQLNYKDENNVTQTSSFYDNNAKTITIQEAYKANTVMYCLFRTNLVEYNGSFRVVCTRRIETDIANLESDVSDLDTNKVGNDEIIAKINVSPEQIQIAANKVNIDGKEIKFQTSDNGKISFVSGGQTLASFHMANAPDLGQSAALDGTMPIYIASHGNDIELVAWSEPSNTQQKYASLYLDNDGALIFKTWVSTYYQESDIWIESDVTQLSLSDSGGLQIQLADGTTGTVSTAMINGHECLVLT